MKKIIILSAITALTLNAASFQNIGYKSISMGGASVSNATGDMAVYSNPALLADNDRNTDTSFGFSLSIKDQGGFEALMDISDLNYANIEADVNNDISGTTLNGLKILKQGRDVLKKNEYASFTIKQNAHSLSNIGNFGFGILNTTEITGKLQGLIGGTRLIVWSDINNDGIEDESDIYTDIEKSNYNISGEISDLGNSTKTEYDEESLFNLRDNLGNNVAKAVSIVEIPVGYGHMFNPDKNSQVMLGLAGKVLLGNVTYLSYYLNEAPTNTITYGVDVGLAYRNNLLRNVTFGIVAKNINSPEFKVLGYENYILKPAVKAGASYKGSWYEVAYDQDLTENETFNGLEKMAGGGFSVSPWNGTSLRVGAKTNLLNEDKDLIYTAGLGLGFKWISLDIAGQYGGKTVHSLDGKILKQNMGISLNLISRF